MTAARQACLQCGEHQRAIRQALAACGRAERLGGDTSAFVAEIKRLKEKQRECGVFGHALGRSRSIASAE